MLGIALFILMICLRACCARPRSTNCMVHIGVHEKSSRASESPSEPMGADALRTSAELAEHCVIG